MYKWLQNPKYFKLVAFKRSTITILFIKNLCVVRVINSQSAGYPCRIFRMSPSAQIYSLPSSRNTPFSLHLANEPASIKSL